MSKNFLFPCLMAVSIVGSVAIAPDTADAFQLTASGNMWRKWGDPTFGTPATVTYSFMPTGTNCATLFSGCTVTSLADFMPTGFLSEIKKAFNSWSAIANINFVEVADDAAPFDATTTSGDIRIGGRPIDNFLAFGYYPPINSISQAGDIHFDVNSIWKIGFDSPAPGYDLFTLAVHEIGHAIGLDHQTEVPSVMYPFYNGMMRGVLQGDDIAGAQYIYGSRPIEPPASIPEPGTVTSLLGFSLLGLTLKKKTRGDVKC